MKLHPLPIIRSFEKVLFLTGVIIIPLLSSCSNRARSSEQKSLFQLLQQDSVLNLTIQTDWKALMEDRTNDEEQAATLMWTMPDGTIHQIEAKAALRGHMRRTYCDMPPIKLKFDKDMLKAAGLNPAYTSLKLVTQCMADNDDITLREYLTYKIWNELSDKSFQVQLANICYQTNKGKAYDISFGFLIEDSDEMAARLKGQLLEGEEMQHQTIHAAQYQLMTVFQYMIGNTDWSIKNGHNVKMLQIADANAPIPVPYDFDYAGLVDAPYAVPPSILPIKNVRERYFQWRGKDTKGLQETLHYFKTKKEKVLDIVQNCKLLSKESRRDMLQYLESFYEKIDDLPAQIPGKKV